jgi:dipeptidyl aminopeptidase/acylaminoacyl peptidase
VHPALGRHPGGRNHGSDPGIGRWVVERRTRKEPNPRPGRARVDTARAVIGGAIPRLIRSAVEAIALATMVGIPLAGAADRAASVMPAVAFTTSEGARIDFVDPSSLRAWPLPRSIRSIPAVCDVVGGPQGKRLAFADGSRIFVAKVDGTHLRPVTPDRRSTLSPSWSPDGRRIVYQRGSNVVVVRVRDQAIRRVWGGGGEVFYPTFRADGRRILFTRTVDGKLRHWTVRTSGRGAHVLPITQGGFGAYSPTDPVIAFRRTSYDGIDVTQMTNATVWLADAEGRNVRMLGRVRGAWMSQVSPNALWPAWSPDGRRIVHQRLYELPIVVHDLRSGERLMIGFGSEPDWLDDDTLIIKDFVSWRAS